ncbi:hypothetical protein J2W40_001902 [Sphingobium xenophagum]|uniref:Transposase n=1 Tax=Sphingobium xenophagum TaxID=121428 RepID=A0ABU1X0H3_SPHXE|nr:hypothetical protein [Sphingobium xenophagum]
MRRFFAFCRYRENTRQIAAHVDLEFAAFRDQYDRVDERTDNLSRLEALALVVASSRNRPRSPHATRRPVSYRPDVQQKLPTGQRVRRRMYCRPIRGRGSSARPLNANYVHR